MRLRSACLFGLSLGLVAQERPVLIHHVRVFDGTKVLEVDSVLVQGGMVAAVGQGLKAPEGAELVDGTGQTLLPGLIDAHTHAWGVALSQALLFGVTTELDMFTDAAFARETKAHPKAMDADLRSAGTLATAPGGHGTEYGMKIPTLSKPEEAEAFVAARFAEGSDYLKIVVDDGHAYGMKTPTLDAATVKALVAAAHRQGRMAVVHVGSLAGAKLALQAGADGLVHTFEDTAPDAEVVKLAAASKAFVIPTLSVNASVTFLTPGKTLAEDVHLAPWLVGGQKGELLASFGAKPKQLRVDYAHAEASVRAFKAAGVPLLAGTDAPNPGTTHGASLHGELARLVAAGLSPVEALQSATAAPARSFHLDDRGRIAPGLRADLLLVKGDPTTDITATRAITRVWKAGVALDRAAALAALPKDGKAAELGSGPLLGAFEGSMAAPFGTGWMPSTDAIMGGKSDVKLDLASEGAAGTKGSLLMKGTVAPGSGFAWAGTIWFPAAKPFDPVDASARKTLSFWAKGDGQTYRVLLYSAQGGYRPSDKTFVAGAEWKAFTFPLSDFTGVDPKGLTAIAFVAGPQPGVFQMQLDEIALK